MLPCIYVYEGLRPDGEALLTISPQSRIKSPSSIPLVCTGNGLVRQHTEPPPCLEFTMCVHVWYKHGGGSVFPHVCSSTLCVHLLVPIWRERVVLYLRILGDK